MRRLLVVVLVLGMLVGCSSPSSKESARSAGEIPEDVVADVVGMTDLNTENEEEDVFATDEKEMTPTSVPEPKGDLIAKSEKMFDNGDYISISVYEEDYSTRGHAYVTIKGPDIMQSCERFSAVLMYMNDSSFLDGYIIWGTIHEELFMLVYEHGELQPTLTPPNRAILEASEDMEEENALASLDVYKELISLTVDADGNPLVEPELDEEEVISQLEIETLDYDSEYSKYAFLVIGNNSDYTLDVVADVTFYDEDGNLVGAKSSSVDVLENGFDGLLYFMLDEDFASMEYDLSVNESTMWSPVLSDLSYEETEAKNKIIISVTNNGDEAATFVKALVLFYENNEIVGFSQSYCVDDDNEIKPNDTINEELRCYEDFDSYRIFLTGRR